VKRLIESSMQDGVGLEDCARGKNGTGSFQQRPRRPRGRNSFLILSTFLIDDYGNVGNAISGRKEIGTALLSLHLRWGGSADSFSFVNGGLPTRSGPGGSRPAQS
jgi:hypothetical protein